MKSVLAYGLILVLILYNVTLAIPQSVVWSENFELADGTSDDPNPPTIWSIDISAANFTSKSYYEVKDGQMAGKATFGEVIWTSEEISISSLSDAVISMTVNQDDNMEADDYFRAYYILDNGPEELFIDISGDLPGKTAGTYSLLGINGNTLQIVIRLANNNDKEIWIFDGVSVATTSSVYSLGSGNWDDDQNWSLSRGGAPCSCIPNVLNPAIITDGSIISIDNSYTVPSITVESGGKIQWVGGNVLSVISGSTIVVEDLASIDGSGENSVIEFLGDGDLIIQDTSVGVLVEEIRTNGDLTISGSGILSINSDFIMSGNNSTVVNDLSGEMQIGGVLEYSDKSSDVSFLNNGNLTIDKILMDYYPNTLINNGQLTIINDLKVGSNQFTGNSIVNGASGVFTANEINMNNAEGFSVDNYGSFEITTELKNASPVDNSFNNFSGASLFFGDKVDTDLNLEASYENNLVEYLGADQDIISPVSSYNNLSISGSGVKTSEGVLDVDGTLLVSSSLITSNNILLGGDLNVTGNIDQTDGNFILDGANQDINAKGSTIGPLEVNGTETKTISGDILIDGDVTVNSTLQFSGEPELQLTGDWIINGTFVNGQEKLLFSGSNDQQIAGFPVINDLEINKTGGIVSIESDTDIYGVLNILSASQFDADGLSDNRVLTLKKDENGEGVIGPIPAGASVSGDITIEEYYPDFGTPRWRYISIPALNVPVTDIQAELPISGNFTGSSNGQGGIPSGASGSLAYYDNSTAAIDLDTRWIFFPIADNTELMSSSTNPGRGYAIYIYETGDISFDVRGPITQGDVNFQLSASNERWNLVGNPYPSPIDWDALGWQKEGIQGNAIHIRSYDQYLVWNGSMGSLGSGRIAKGQSFWIQGSQDQMTLSISETVKSSVSTPNLRTEKSEVPYLELSLNHQGRSDKTYITFNENSSETMDIYDVLKYPNSIFNLSSLTPDGQDLVINSITQKDCRFTIPLKLSNVDAGDYTFSWSNKESLPATYRISLKDNYVAKISDLTAENSYGFNMTVDPQTQGSGRFELIFEVIDLPEAEVIVKENCEESTYSLQLSNAVRGAEYILLNQTGDSLVTSVATGKSHELVVEKDHIENGTNEFIIRTVLPCGLSSDSNISIELEKAPILTFNKSELTLNTTTSAPVNWYLNDQLIKENGASTIFPTQLEGHYRVSAFNSFGCEIFSNPVHTQVEAETEDIKLFPNPTTQYIFVSLTEKEKYESLKIIDLRGRLKFQAAIEESLIKIDVSDYDFGIYEIRLLNGRDETVRKFIKR